MKITISGNLGSGKSTVAKEIAKKLGLKHLSMGDLQRSIATEMGLTLEELQKLEETDPSYDRIVDEGMAKIGQEEDNFIIDARIGFHFIPDSIKIFMSVDPKIAAERVFKNQRPEEGKVSTVQELIKVNETRTKSEQKRYKEYYEIDHLNMENYDFVIDSSNKTVGEITKEIIDFVKKHDAGNII